MKSRAIFIVYLNFKDISVLFYLYFWKWEWITFREISYQVCFLSSYALGLLLYQT